MNIEEKIRIANALLPAWFIPRMMEESWTYGLMLPNGHVIAIERINNVSRAVDGSVWLDVTLAAADDVWGGNYDPGIFGAPTARRNASINVAHVAAAFELVDKVGTAGHAG